MEHTVVGKPMKLRTSQTPEGVRMKPNLKVLGLSPDVRYAEGELRYVNVKLKFNEGERELRN